MVVMSLEEHVEGKRVFGGQHLFQEAAHMQRHRVGARGNATCFLLPWSDMLAKLAETEAASGAGNGPDLPHTGAELANLVRIRLKGTEKETSKYIADATVRRDVVVDLILMMAKRNTEPISTLMRHES